MNSLDEFLQWSNEIHAATKQQRDTVKRLNDLTPHHNGRVHADAVAADWTEFCINDSGHGPGTVNVNGDMLCPHCGLDATQLHLTSTTGPDHIYIEVYL